MVNARYLVVPALAVAVVASAAVHADPVDDYVALKAQSLCARLDKSRSVGDVVTLALIVAREAGLSLRDAASAVGLAAATDCPRNSALIKQVRDSLNPSGS